MIPQSKMPYVCGSISKKELQVFLLMLFIFIFMVAGKCQNTTPIHNTKVHNTNTKVHNTKAHNTNTEAHNTTRIQKPTTQIQKPTTQRKLAHNRVVFALHKLSNFTILCFLSSYRGNCIAAVLQAINQLKLSQNYPHLNQSTCDMVLVLCCGLLYLCCGLWYSCCVVGFCIRVVDFCICVVGFCICVVDFCIHVVLWHFPATVDKTS